MKIGKCWFGVDSKTFEISVEGVKGKLLGKILEGGRGCSSWIRFVELSLSHLLDGVESCSQGDEGKPFNKQWLEGGRVYRVECRYNDVGRFFLCLMHFVEAKRFVLVFLKKKALLRVGAFWLVNFEAWEWPLALKLVEVLWWV